MFRSLAAGVMVLAATAGCTQVAPEPDRSPTLGDDTTAPTTAEEVVVKRGGAPSMDQFLWAAWTDTDEGLAELWSEFGQTAGTRPDLGERPVVLVATGESGSCPLTIRDVAVETALLVLDRGEDPRDDQCTADFNPVTFVLTLDSDALRPPFVVDLGGTSVRVEQPDTLSAANHVQREWELHHPAA